MWMVAWPVVEGATIMVRARKGELTVGHVGVGAAGLRDIVKMLQAALLHMFESHVGMVLARPKCYCIPNVGHLGKRSSN